MLGIDDLFQWERFVTPTFIKVFYWLAVVVSVLLGLAGAFSALTTMAFNPFVGMIFLIASLLGACMGIILRASWLNSCSSCSASTSISARSGTRDQASEISRPRVKKRRRRDET